MTIRKRLRGLLVDHGMFDADADKIIDRYLASEIGAPMKGRINDALDGYPPQLLPTVWVAVRAIAVDWIDENCPAHWARPMFVESEAANKAESRLP